MAAVGEPWIGARCMATVWPRAATGSTRVRRTRAVLRRAACGHTAAVPPARNGLRPLALAALALGPAACGGGRARVVVPTQPAAGRSPLCPEAPVGIDGSPDVRRCSYEDAIGRGATRLAGRVVLEGPVAGTGRGVPDLVVTIHAAGDPSRAAGYGKIVGRARTDAQGRFSLSIVLPPGRYDLVARRDPEGAPLAVRRIDLEGAGTRRLDDLLLTIPRR